MLDAGVRSQTLKNSTVTFVRHKKHERKRVNNFSEKCEVVFSKKETLKFQILDRGGATEAGFESSAEFRGNVFGPNSRHFSTRVRL